MSGKEPRISQCMIVKNEERNIERALSWGREIMWEQIVVDTGSTDRTVELAQAMGAKVCHFEWIDDFAAAKNFAISQASGDWIAFLDADEYLTEEWVRQLPELLTALDGTVLYAVRSPWICIDEGKITTSARHCRFFRCMPNLRYYSAIHEYLVLNGETLSENNLLDVGEKFPVYHTGYTKADGQDKKKNERNIQIIKKQLKKQPNSYIMMGYLGDAYAETENESDEAERWYRNAVELMPETISKVDERSALTFINLLLILVQKKAEEEKVLEVYRLARKRVPWVYDIDHIMGRYYLDRQDDEKTIYHLEQGLQVYEEYGTSAYGVYMSTNIAGIWEVLAVCYYRLGNYPTSVRYCTALLQADNRQFNTLTLLLKLLEKEKPEDVLNFLKNLYQIQNSSDRIFLLRAVLRVGLGGLLQLLRRECTPQELAMLDQLNG